MFMLGIVHRGPAPLRETVPRTVISDAPLAATTPDKAGARFDCEQGNPQTGADAVGAGAI
jgi:hypothetical protein